MIIGRSWGVSFVMTPRHGNIVCIEFSHTVAIVFLFLSNRIHKMNLKISPLFFLALSSFAAGSNALLTNPVTGTKGAVNK